MHSANTARINGNCMKKLKFYLLTDTHYFEESLGAEGKAYEEYMKTEAFYLKESSAINKAVFKKLKEDKETELIIIPGDLSKDGEYESHKSLINELNDLKQSGKKIFVLTAGHDYNEHGRSYKNDEFVPVKGTEFKELYNLYYEFGYKDALSVDEETLSYIAEIAPNIRLLALNCDSKRECKGLIDERLLNWAKEQLQKAKEDGVYTIAMCHYPVIPSVPVFDLVGDAHVKNWREIASFLADNGVELVLTGHMHIQSINEFTSESGNKLYDICTATTVGTPGKYRKIEIAEDGTMNVKSINVEGFSLPDEFKTAEEFFDWRFKYSVKNKINKIHDGGSGITKTLKSFGGKILNSIKLKTIARLLFIKIDSSLKDVRLIDFACDLATAIFKGDMPYIKGTPEYDAISKALKRLSFVLKKIEPKLSKNGVKTDLTDMLLNTIGNNKGYSDNNATINLKG
ncbi:MAG: metallophosphoesterase [Ruminococcaceae bacterium]|nr:metallophosphoesterase [Oscillospiraceae bacterium]